MMTEKTKCAACDSENVAENMETETFQYGSGDNDDVQLQAIVPMLTCKDCGFSWTDYRGEDARTQALLIYLQRCNAVYKTNLRKIYSHLDKEIRFEQDSSIQFILGLVKGTLEYKP